MTPEFDKVYEGLWDNINKAKKRGRTSSKWKKSSKYRKQMKSQAKKLAKEKKLCARGKAAAKAKFDVYPSAYANAYASKVCAGKDADTGKYPKCVPAKKAYSMSKGQKSASVSRKRKAERKGRSGKKPNYSKT